MTTAAEIITNALRLYGIIDQTESAQPADIANNVVILNDMLRNEQADGAAQFLMEMATVTLPAGVNGQFYSFNVGNQQTSYLIQKDVLAVKAIWMNDLNLTVNRETRMAPKADVVRTTFPGIVTKWHQERQVDGSVRVYAWQPPNRPVQALIEYGARMPILSAADGSDTVALPPEAIHDATLLLGLTVCGSYGRPSDKLDPVLLQRAMSVDMRWRQWARGQQWLRFVRA
jgi:hypothetical protein